MAGRRVENQRRQKYGTSSYVSGNTARKLAAAPQRRYEEYDIPKEVEITEEDRIAIRKKRKAIHPVPTDLISCIQSECQLLLLQYLQYAYNI